MGAYEVRHISFFNFVCIYSLQIGFDDGTLCVVTKLDFDIYNDLSQAIFTIIVDIAEWCTQW